MRANDPDYRSLVRSIKLPDTGLIPKEPIPAMTEVQRDRWRELIGHAWSALEALSTHRSLPQPSRLAMPELARAWRNWFESHQGFFVLYLLLTDVYRSLAESAGDGDVRLLMERAKRATELNHGAGALLALGVDFQPTRHVYEEVIRPTMPKGFTGYALREAVTLAEARAAWLNVSDAQPGVGEAKKVELAGRSRYKRYHVDVMRRAVNGPSLKISYAEELGHTPEIGDAEFCAYDRWFNIERRPLARLDLAESTCWVVQQVVGNVVAGSRLERDTIVDLRVGLEAALRIVASWFGPVSESSAYFPRESRGE